MKNEDELQRQININIQLRRQLEQCRKDVVEYCAKFCEDHEVEREMGKWYLQESVTKNHEGKAYAEGLRGIIGK
jgi:hypothetical protein